MDFEKLAQWLFPDVTLTPEDMEKRYPERQLPQGAVVSRMAPSPTGFVHLGNLVQGLTSERLCHQSGGVLFLRIEDTDSKREIPGAVKILIEALDHYGIRFDEGAGIEGDIGDYGPYTQSLRKDIYHVYAKYLTQKGMAYPCFCTEEDLENMRKEQEAAHENFGYYGKYAVWRDRSLEDIRRELDAGHPFVLRFRSTGNPENKHKFTDLVKGEIVLTENEMDQVLLKSDGIPTYHFAHAVDDHLMRTTLVVRGDEWLPSLPFHVQLFQSLGFKLPKYAHIGPLMKMDGESKRKLSKRKDPELALTFYESEGFPVSAVYEYILGILNSNYEDWRRANPDADPSGFTFSYKKLNPAGSLFDYDKLLNVSKNVISRMTADQVYDELLEYTKAYDPDLFASLTADPDYAKAILSIGRGGKKPRKDLATWKEAKPYMSFFYDAMFERTDPYPETISQETVKKVLTAYLTMYEASDDQTVWFDKIKALSESFGFATDMKAYKENPQDYPGSVADISGLIRVALTGRQSSPDMYAVMQILGQDRVRARLQNAVSALG
ncbi:MAG: glutamate--tRNA ligase [Clostridia bacterium]|nr:glutamate--tRNA ligase [Clostridia bacterium]